MGLEMRTQKSNIMGSLACGLDRACCCQLVVCYFFHFGGGDDKN